MIGIVLPAEPSVAGSVKDRVTGALAWPVTSKRPAFVRSMAAIVLFTPGNTFPKLNGWAPSTLIGVCTLAVAVMLALFDWAWSAVPPRARAATTRDSFVMLRISLLLVWCRAISQLEGHSAPPPFRKLVRARVMPAANFLCAVKFFDDLGWKDGNQNRTSS